MNCCENPNIKKGILYLCVLFSALCMTNVFAQTPAQQRESLNNYKIASSYFDKKDYDTALDWYLKVLKDTPLNSEVGYRALVESGVSYYNLSNLEMAEEIFTKAIKIEPFKFASNGKDHETFRNEMLDLRSNVYYYRGMTRVNLNNSVGACLDFQSMNDFVPNSGDEYLNQYCDKN